MLEHLNLILVLSLDGFFQGASVIVVTIHTESRNTAEMGLKWSSSNISLFLLGDGCERTDSFNTSLAPVIRSTVTSLPF